MTSRPLSAPRSSTEPSRPMSPALPMMRGPRRREPSTESRDQLRLTTPLALRVTGPRLRRNPTTTLSSLGGPHPGRTPQTHSGSLYGREPVDGLSASPLRLYRDLSPSGARSRHYSPCALQ